MELYVNGEVFDAWESIGALISTESLNSDIKNISIHFVWRPPPNSIACGFLATGFESVLRKAEVLDSLLENYFKHLATLTLEMEYWWPSDLEDTRNHLLTRFSQPAIERALRKKLPKISQKVRLNVLVSHHT